MKFFTYLIRLGTKFVVLYPRHSLAFFVANYLDNVTLPIWRTLATQVTPRHY